MPRKRASFWEELKRELRYRLLMLAFAIICSLLVFLYMRYVLAGQLTRAFQRSIDATKPPPTQRK